MLDLLTKARAEVLPGLLEDPDAWESLYIDYLPPVVERLWVQWGDNRINLHCIHRCPDEPFFHPHPWPCAIMTVAGWQEMGVGHGPGVEPPPVAAKVMMGPGASYEMTEFDSWHYVKVTSEHMLSIMITGKPWDRKMPQVPNNRLRSLPTTRKDELLRSFRFYLNYSELMGG